MSEKVSKSDTLIDIIKFVILVKINEKTVTVN